MVARWRVKQSKSAERGSGRTSAGMNRQSGACGHQTRGVKGEEALQRKYTCSWRWDVNRRMKERRRGAGRGSGLCLLTGRGGRQACLPRTWRFHSGDCDRRWCLRAIALPSAWTVSLCAYTSTHLLCLYGERLQRRTDVGFCLILRLPAVLYPSLGVSSPPSPNSIYGRTACWLSQL